MAPRASVFSLRPAAKGQIFPTERKAEAPVLTHHILGILIHIVRTESGKSAFKKEKDRQTQNEHSFTPPE